MTTIVLVDDHPIVRGGLRAALAAEPDWQVVGEGDDGVEGLTLVNQLHPDILVVDLQLPTISGLDVLRQVRVTAPATRVIFFSMHSEDAYVREALAAGAVGYVLKDADAVELIHGIRVALQGGRYLSPTLAERMISAYLHQPSPDQHIDWAEMLTARERQVLILAAQGLSNAEIGDRLTISPRTAETHRTNLLRKLGLKGQTDLMHFAHERGLLEE
ncbi:two component LuxR family transcriptional regulator [Oscillochloris trichoides DG-6]|uniref:Two component LuxR family transcriptional regulator n=1 Tax=Oscillochloris trichoides DG-6 TaxID=765420 RepID=E1IDR0_9CHLR|nr:response regulator transcription factor [Oscillochloris trichoides]EFO80688.1 two component LuxR family transcriptional regulator [Oscillochloris trichoides DG-6]